MKRREAKALGLKTYNTGKPCPRGHVGERRVSSGSCVICANESRVKARWDARTDIKDEHRIISRQDARNFGLIYYYTGKQCKHGHNSVRFTSTSICKECNRIHADKVRKANPEYMPKYHKNNAGRLAQRRKEEPEYAMVVAMREMLRRVKRLTGLKKGTRTESVLGYGREELVKHLESMFKSGMNWSNHGEWHIDHIVPVSVMIKRGITDPKVINALSNLQPLWAEENHRKSAKIGKE
jgi:hypothetical protein